MSDTKELTWGDAARADVADYDGDAEQPTDAAAESWDAYRNWLSRAPAPNARNRIASDATIYTWKGYRSWADKVKRNWDDRSDGESS